MYLAGSSSNIGKSGFGIATWPLTANNPLQTMESRSSPGGTFHRSEVMMMSSRLHQSDGDLSYHVDDSPSLLAGETISTVRLCSSEKIRNSQSKVDPGLVHLACTHAPKNSTSLGSHPRVLKFLDPPLLIFEPILCFPFSVEIRCI